MSNQLRKHIRKQSRAYQVKRLEDALKYNPLDKSAEDALLALKYPKKKGQEDYGN